LKTQNYITAVLLILIIVIISCGGPGNYVGMTAHEQFETAKEEYDKGKYYKSINSFQRVIFNYPGATVVDTAQYYLAMSYYNNEEYELASVEFMRLVRSYPQSEYADEAQFMIGMSYFENAPGHYALTQEELKRAIAALEDFVIDNPDSPLIEDAKEKILEGRTRLARKEYENGIFYKNIYAYESSLIYFQLVIDDYTDTEYASEALYRIGEIKFRQKKYDEALDKFSKYLSLYPEGAHTTEVNKYIDSINQEMDTTNVASDS